MVKNDDLSRAVRRYSIAVIVCVIALCVTALSIVRDMYTDAEAEREAFMFQARPVIRLPTDKVTLSVDYNSDSTQILISLIPKQAL